MKFYEKVVNAGRLRDVGCPYCGSRGPFSIELHGLAKVVDAIAKPVTVVTPSWDCGAFMVCSKCGTSDVAGVFTATGLDDKLANGEDVATPELDSIERAREYHHRSTAISGLWSLIVALRNANVVTDASLRESLSQSGYGRLEIDAVFEQLALHSA